MCLLVTLSCRLQMRLIIVLHMRSVKRTNPLWIGSVRGGPMHMEHSYAARLLTTDPIALGQIHVDLWVYYLCAIISQH